MEKLLDVGILIECVTVLGVLWRSFRSWEKDNYG